MSRSRWEEPGPDLAERMQRAVPQDLLRDLIDDSHRGRIVAPASTAQWKRETPEEHAAAQRLYWETNGGKGWEGGWDGNLSLEAYGRKHLFTTGEVYDPETWYEARHADVSRRRDEHSRRSARGQW